MTEPAPLSRRQLLRAAAVGAGLGAFGLGRLTQLVSAGEAGGPLNEPGTALQPADRLSLRPTTTTTTTTTTTPTTTTLPPGEPPPFEPPPEGMLIFPLVAASDCYALDNFGDCRGNGCSRLHEGIDIMGSRDQPVVSVANGVLVKQYVDSGLTFGAGSGWALYDEENQRSYRYFHLSSLEEGLEEGDTVELGDVLGYVGNTGTSGVPTDSNYHLHFEVRDVVGSSHWDSVAVDPLPLIVVPDEMCDVSPPIKG